MLTNIFIIVTSACIITIGVFICKLLISLTKLSDNANIIATSLQKEIEPTLQELK